MSAEFPSSSSQSPFATPQPAAVPAGSQAISPPTKQSLKSWWKGFRPPAKSQETHGNNPSSSSHTSSQQQHFHASAIFATRIPSGISSVFQEGSVYDDTSVTDSLPPVEVSPTSSGRRTSTYHTLSRGMIQRTKRLLRHTHPMGSSFKKTNPSYRTRNKRPASVLSKPQALDKKRGSLSKRRAFTANFGRDQRGARLTSGRTFYIPKPQSLLNFFELVQSKCFATTKSKQNAKQIVEIVEPPTGIFGVPLRQSITYANVAISLVDGEGKSYIYGYVPIVVAKCGVYLKEKGLFLLLFLARQRFTDLDSD